MKPLICIVLTLCMMLSLCACAAQEKITVPKAEPTSTEAITEAPIPSSEDEPEASEEDVPNSEEASEIDPTIAADPILAEKLIGAWDWEFDVSKLMVEQLSVSLGMDLTEKSADLKLAFCCTFEFAEDGSCKVYFDEENLRTSFDSFLDGLCGVLTDITYEMLAEQGMTAEDAEANFVSEYGCGVFDYYDELMSASLDLDAMFAELPEIDSTYKLEGDQLTVAKDGVYGDDAATVSIDGDVMTLDGELDADILSDFAAYGVEFPITMTRK